MKIISVSLVIAGCLIFSNVLFAQEQREDRTAALQETADKIEIAESAMEQETANKIEVAGNTVEQETAVVVTETAENGPAVQDITETEVLLEKTPGIKEQAAPSISPEKVPTASDTEKSGELSSTKLTSAALTHYGQTPSAEVPIPQRTNVLPVRPAQKTAGKTRKDEMETWTHKVKTNEKLTEAQKAQLIEQMKKGWGNRSSSGTKLSDEHKAFFDRLAKESGTMTREEKTAAVREHFVRQKAENQVRREGLNDEQKEFEK